LLKKSLKSVNNMTFDERIKYYKNIVDDSLKQYFKCDLEQKIIFDAMYYSIDAGGKRIRPLLMLEFGRICGGEIDEIMPFACALEMVHTYSLIHDDLPCMDDDDYRRGKLTNHKVYGEANAVLAGDGLLNLAFETMLSAKCDAQKKVMAASTLAENSGVYGMIGGQVLDLMWQNNDSVEDKITLIDSLKTGALIKAACKMGCVLSGASEEQILASERYAECIGIAFQIKDDLLDVEGNPELIGKNVNADQKFEKQTYVKLYGVEKCHALIDELSKNAKNYLKSFNNSEFLEELTDYLAKRDK